MTDPNRTDAPAGIAVAGGGRLDGAVDGRGNRGGAGDREPSTRSSSPRPSAPRACRTSPNRSAPSTRTPSRCAACSRSTTSRSTSRASRSRSASRAARPSCSAASRVPASSSAACPSSALYLDEQPITQSGRSPDPRFIDIERIEALRGPQGTLYGASSQSGHAARHHQQARSVRLRRLGRGAGHRPSGRRHGATTSARWSTCRSARTAWRCASSASRPKMRATSTTCSRDSQGGRPSTTRTSSRRTSTASRRTARARRCASTSPRTSTLTLGAGLPGRPAADGHSDVTRGRRATCNQVRFEDESLDDEWYQARADVQRLAAVRRPRGRRRPTSTASSPTRPTRPTTSSVVQPESIVYASASTTSAATRAASPRTTRTPRSRPLEARLQSNNDAESRWSWLAGVVLQQGGRDTPSSTASCATTQDTPAFAYFNDFEYNELTGIRSRRPTMVPGPIYDTELEQRAVVRRGRLRRHGELHDHGRRPLVRVRPDLQPAPGIAGRLHRLQRLLDDADRVPTRDGTVMKLNLTYRIDDDRMVYATYSEGFRNGGSNPVRPNSILPREFSSDTLDELRDRRQDRVAGEPAALQRRGLLHGAGTTSPSRSRTRSPACSSSATSTCRAPRSRASRPSSLSWSTTPGRSTRRSATTTRKIAEATVLTLDGRRRQSITACRSRTARGCPLTPDWSGSLGIEWRPRGQLLERAAVRARGLRLRRRGGHEPRGLRVRRRPGRRQRRRTPTRRATSASASRARPGAASFFVDNVWDERAVTFRSNRWADATPVDHPAAHLRNPVPLRLLTRAWTSAYRSATSARSTWRRSAPPSSPRTRRPGTRTSSARRTTRSTSRRARSCCCSRTSRTGRRSR